MHKEFTTIQQLLHYAQGTSKNLGKGIYIVGIISETLAHKIIRVSGLQVAKHQQFGLLLGSDGIRHTLAQHGIAKSILEAARGQLPITDSDLLALPSWLPTPTTIRPGQLKPSKQPRVEFDYVESTATTTAILEWRPGRQQLALVAMYKKGQLPKQLTFFL